MNVRTVKTRNFPDEFTLPHPDTRWVTFHGDEGGSNAEEYSALKAEDAKARESKTRMNLRETPNVTILPPDSEAAISANGERFTEVLASVEAAPAVATARLAFEAAIEQSTASWSAEPLEPTRQRTYRQADVR